MSAQQGHAEAVLLLLSFAASANAAAHGGALPATSAAAQQHEAALRALLDAGADPSLRGSHGQTALEYEGSAGRGCGPVAKLLQSRMGVSPDSFVADSQDSPSARVGTLVPARTVQVLIDPGSTHAGAGSYIVDGALPEEFLIQVEELWRSLPIADKKQAGSDRIIHRSYFCDSEGWLGAAVRHALRGTQCCEVHDCIRFLHYFEPGGQLPPHTDLSKTNAAGQRSTHTLLIYLATCSVGGETVLLESLGPGARVFATVQPRRGRMLIFPHDCPHKAEPVVEVPKVVVRGEAH